MRSILFICTANRFRSPIAAIHFARLVVRKGYDKLISVSSAGTWTVPGKPVTPEALNIAKRYNLNLSLHQSRPLTEAVLNQAHLAIVMENSHKEAILQEFPTAGEKVFLLAEVVKGVSEDIPDPYASDELPEVIADEIITMINLGYKNIVQLALNNGLQ
jgi:protein-tyrosine-phosphatase